MKITWFSGRRLHGLAVSLILVVVGYLAFAQWSGWEKFFSAVKMVGVAWLGLLLMLSLLNYGLRFVRWQNYLGVLGTNLPFTLSALIYVAGFALTMTPGKAGEMYRGVFLKSYGMTYTHSTVAFVSERLSDLLAIVLLAMLGVVFIPHWGIMVFAGMIIIIMSLVLLSHSRILVIFSNKLANRPGWLARASQHGLVLLMEARCCHTPRILLSATLLSILAWSAEASAFYIILHRIGFNASLPFAFAVYALAALAGALSFLPGGLGGTEAVMVGLLLMGGMPEAQAIAATVVIRLTTLWFAVSLGVMALVVGRRALLIGTDD
ncbi:MAG: lysylphosphatidylglycerol synthase transmembrane domain-containing protein [Desulfosporosinus sp.]|nr:lysylphosphatidylglycerol synthase transmembrane domain-containing protein [Desulfosporosinus sp.]